RGCRAEGCAWQTWCASSKDWTVVWKYRISNKKCRMSKEFTSTFDIFCSIFDILGLLLEPIDQELRCGLVFRALVVLVIEHAFDADGLELLLELDAHDGGVGRVGLFRGGH